MAQFSITIPNEFLPALDEIVLETGAPSRDVWLKNFIGTTLVQRQLSREPQTQQRLAQLFSLWK